MHTLNSISVLDGRYYGDVNSLSKFFSEYALIKQRVNVEIQYVLYLADNGFFNLEEPIRNKLIRIHDDFDIEHAFKIKQIEIRINHDVKAVEYFLKDKFYDFKITELQGWIHFGLTSQDINNTAIPLIWKEFINKEYTSRLTKLISQIEDLAKQYINSPILSRTHGQPATPTTFGKELMVFVERLNSQLSVLKNIPHTGKFGGAVGNLTAHRIAFPKYDWVKFANDFLSQRLGLERQQHTTQIEHYDMLSASFDALKRINNILIDLCKDIWMYASFGYLKLKSDPNQVGSSTMPHKINPINFENAEGNLGIANNSFEYLSSKLPISRLQRDLTDSTVIRNIGTPASHTILAINSIQNGLKKIVLDEDKTKKELLSNWSVITEAYQTILRRENYPNAYEVLKMFIEKNEINQNTLHTFIDSLLISDNIKSELKIITPLNYI